MTNDDSVPVSELRELVEQWQDNMERGFIGAANELEQLIEEHTDE